MESLTRREKLEHLAAAIVGDKKASTLHVIAALTSCSDFTLDRIVSSLNGIPQMLHYLLVVTGPSDEYLNDWLTIEPIAIEEVMDSAPVIAGLERYEHLTSPENMQRRIEETSAIARVTAYFLDLGHGVEYDINHNGDNIQFIEDTGLREILTTHEKPLDIAALITRRNITDTTQLTALLDTVDQTANAVRNGAL